MGAAVSVAVTKMPDSLDEATLKKICGTRFDELKSADGFLAKTDLLEELAKPEYTVVTTTKKIRALRSTFDQLLNENLSNSQKVKFIRKSFHAGTLPADGENDDETNSPIDNNDPVSTAEPTVDGFGVSNCSDIPHIAQFVEVNNPINPASSYTPNMHLLIPHSIVSQTHVLMYSFIHCFFINQVNGISPEHISASSEKSIEEDDEWRLMTEPQVGIIIIIIIIIHHVCVKLTFCRHTLSYSNRPSHLLRNPWFCCFLLSFNTHSLSLTFHSLSLHALSHC